MKTLIFIIIFLLTGAFFIISENDIQLNSSDNISSFFSIYGGWIDSLIKNSVHLSGYVVKMEWLPGEGK